MLAAILSGFIGSLLAPFIYRFTKKYASWLIALIPFSLSIYFSSFIPIIAKKGPLSFSHTWIPGLGVNFSFYLDGLSILFAVVISFIGTLVLVYAGSYFSDHSRVGRFYSHILIFMSAMLGVVLADNIITLFMFWELTGISSFLLIGFDHEKESARKAAWQALLVTGAGGLAMLGGFIILGQIGGSYELSELLNKGDVIKAHPFYSAVFLLIAAGAFTKSAQFPFHFWLPDAMAAPTPVSTYLHSATMVKAGVYLLARMTPILGGTYLWQWVLISAGAATMLLGAWLAMRQTDLKKILAYSTVSVLGTLIFLIGTGTRTAIEAAMAYVMIHALYKAALFLVAGIVDHETGTRDIGKLQGLWRVMPLTCSAAVLAGLSMAGLPPLFGFIGKELLYGATLKAPTAASLLTAVALTTNALLVISAGLVSVVPYLGTKSSHLENVHEPPFTMWLGPALLAGLGIAMGLLPNHFATLWASPAVAAILQEPAQIKLGLMHGFTTQLALSAVTFSFGLAGFIWRKKLLKVMAMASPLFRRGPSQVYQYTINGMNAFARAQTRIIQNGHLHYYILIFVIATVVLTGLSMLNHGGQIQGTQWPAIKPYEWVVAIIILCATFMVVRARSLVIAIISLGVMGYSVVLFYIIHGAPDLAMAQFSIDTLTVILLVLVIYRLPKYVKYSTPWERIRDAIPAIAAGGLITILILFTQSASKGSHLSSFFLENSLVLAKGRNIVNVILVDFRGLDTMGEVTVLSVAGIGVFSLLKLTLGGNK